MRNDDTTFYSYIRGLDGRLESADPIRWCGRLVPRPVPDTRKDESAGSLVSLLRWYRRIMKGLNRAQRRTFLLLLLGWTPEDIAQADGVRRAAIYFRIRGKDGCGGLVARSPYAAFWWESKRKRNQYE